MHKTFQAVPFTQALAYIKQLDLHYIIKTMCAPSYPLPHWLESDAQHCMQIYKNFLHLKKKHPEQILVPSREIDEFWHNHILFTKNYHRDCLQIFGYYFHHEPASPEDEVEILVQNYRETKKLYLETFGYPLDLIKN